MKTILLILMLAPLSAHAVSAWSMFIDAANNGVPPKDREALEALMNKVPGVQQDIFVEMTPSRSSQKNRVVQTFSYRGKRIFVGFSAEKDELEVISEDVGARPSGNSFETYRPLKNNPKHDTSDGKCLGCHQHGGPIFSRDPWREAPRSRGSASIFDRAVRDANAEMQARRVCTSACAKGDWECREAILYMALTQERDKRFTVAPEDFFLSAAAKEPDDRLKRLVRKLPDGILALQKKLEAGWPADGYAYISSVIRDRTPDGKKTAKLPGKMPTGESVEFTDDIVDLTAEQHAGETFEEDAKEAAALADPRADRPFTRAIPKSRALMYLSNVSFNCLGLPADSGAIRKLTPEQITKVLKSPDVRHFLRDDVWPATGEGIWEAIQKSIADKPAPQGGKPSRRTGLRIPLTH